MATPMHQPRKGPQRLRVTLKDAADYPPGYFTEPVRAWVQLRFEPRLTVDPKTKRYATEFAMATRLRPEVGFEVTPLNLPGAKAYTGRQAGWIRPGSTD